MRRELAREPSIDCGSEDTVLILRTRRSCECPALRQLTPSPTSRAGALRETIGPP